MPHQIVIVINIMSISVKSYIFSFYASISKSSKVALCRVLTFCIMIVSILYIENGFYVILLNSLLDEFVNSLCVVMPHIDISSVVFE